MGTVRFSKIVEAAGKPAVHVLWVDPTKDAILQKAIHTNRVLTVHQQLTNAKADYGTVGFQGGVSGQILIFPKSLKRFSGRRVTGVKYDLLEWPTIPKSQKVPKIVAAKPRAKGKPQDPKVLSKSTVEKRAVETVLKFPSPEDDDAEGPMADLEKIKGQVRLAMRALEKGDQVAAVNLLKRIVAR